MLMYPLFNERSILVEALAKLHTKTDATERVPPKTFEKTMGGPRFVVAAGGSAWASKENTSKIEVIFGEFSQSPSVNAWAEVATVRRIEGAGDFLPRWPEEMRLRAEAEGGRLKAED